MTHQEQSSLFEDLLQVLSDHGFEGMSQAIEILMNEAMKLERAEVLGAQPYERKEGRRGYANGYKPKTVNSRLGRLKLQVPQTRDVSSYPSALERGERSERARRVVQLQKQPDSSDLHDATLASTAPRQWQRR